MVQLSPHQSNVEFAALALNCKWRWALPPPLTRLSQVMLRPCSVGGDSNSTYNVTLLEVCTDVIQCYDLSKIGQCIPLKVLRRRSNEFNSCYVTGQLGKAFIHPASYWSWPMMIIGWVTAKGLCSCFLKHRYFKPAAVTTKPTKVD